MPDRTKSQTRQKRSKAPAPPLDEEMSAGVVESMLVKDLRSATESVPQQVPLELLVGRPSAGWRASVNRSYMREMYGGGQLERVSGFDGRRALAEGFGRRYLPGTAPVPQTPPQAPPILARGPVFTDGFKPEVVFGPTDDRVLVPNSAAVPWRCICHLIIKRANNRFAFGTGWLAGPRIVVTAGHCIFDPDLGAAGWAAEVTVVPGRAGDSAPFGYQAGARLEVHPRFANQLDQAYDFGAVILPDSRLSNQVGWFGFGVFPDQDIRMSLVNTGGYPFDKPFGTAWYNGGRISDLDEQYLYYMLDTESGDSGSPVFRTTDDGQRIVVAIHTGTKGLNRGVRISPEISAQLTTWYNLS